MTWHQFFKQEWENSSALVLFFTEFTLQTHLPAKVDGLSLFPKAFVLSEGSFYIYSALLFLKKIRSIKNSHKFKLTLL